MLNRERAARVGNGMLFKKSLPLAAFLALFAGATVPAQAAPAQVKTVSPQGLKAEIARNKGKVVVVNFWATWCAPCVQELPALSKLASNNAKKGAVLILVSGDDPATKSKVALVAGQKGHRTTRLIQGDLDTFFAGFDPKNKDSIALPRTYFYNRKGKLVKTLESEQSLAQYQKLINPLL